MIRLRHFLMMGAMAVSMAAAVGTPVLAQNGGSDAAPSAPGRGYGPGMMGRGYGPGMRGGGFGMMWGAPGMMWGGGPVWMRDARTAQSSVDGELAFLKAELKITPQQQAVWDKYAEAMQASAKTMFEQHRDLFDRDWARESLPERLDRREQLMTLHLDAMKKTDAALKPLYAALDNDQKQIAEDVLDTPMMPFRGGF